MRILSIASVSLALTVFSACANRESRDRDESPAAEVTKSQAPPQVKESEPQGQPKNAVAKVDEADPAAAAAKLAAAYRALALARVKLEKSHADLANQETAGGENISAAKADQELVKSALANFEVTSKLRVEREKSSLQGAADSHAEAEEELAQLELMYEKTELSDKTKELVIKRAQRRIERSKRSLELQRQALANLESLELVQERAKLALDAEAKTRALARAAREATAGLADKRLAVMAQENEVAKLEDDLLAAKRAAEKAAGAQAASAQGTSTRGSGKP